MENRVRSTAKTHSPLETDSSSGGELRLLTMNLGLLRLVVRGKTRGEVPYGERRLEEVIPALAATGADVLCLQEIFTSAQYRALIDGLSDAYPFAVDVGHHDPGRVRTGHGLLILSKCPVQASQFRLFRARPVLDYFMFSRGVLATTVDLGSLLGKINILNVHTTAGGMGRPEGFLTERIRDRQLIELHKVARAYPGRTFVCGDLNAGPEASSNNYRALLARGYADPVPRLSPRGVGPATWDPTNELNRAGRFDDSPPQRVDHVLLDCVAAAALEVVAASTVFEKPAVAVDGRMVTYSDHSGLFVRCRNRELSEPGPSVRTSLDAT